ncbi:MAG: branched-chain amino acid ABC transporter permease [Oscillospiraceae bacterium]|nr:branched-chain amino acid ABC transporter permease [Oscillospiraceae bacterium]
MRKLFLKSIKSSTRNKFSTYIMVIAFFSIAAILVEAGILGSLFKGLLVPMCYYIILAVSLNLTVGILGELSLGHAGFMCVGAYVGGVFSILTKDIITSALIRFPLALVVGGLAAGLFGILIGIPILRLKGDYLAIVTLAFGEIIKKLVQNIYIIKDVTGFHFSFATSIDTSTIDSESKQVILNGPMSISGIPKNANIVIGVILVLITLFVIMNLVDSRSGRAFMAIRDNRIVAEGIGINITKYKLIVFSFSAFFAGVAGSLFAHFSTVDPTKFDYNLSILILVFVVLGGIGNIRGSVIAAVILYALPELLRSFQNYRMLIYAIVLIVMMILNNNEKFLRFKERFTFKRLFAKKHAKEDA